MITKIVFSIILLFTLTGCNNLFNGQNQPKSCSTGTEECLVEEKTLELNYFGIYPICIDYQVFFGISKICTIANWAETEGRNLEFIKNDYINNYKIPDWGIQEKIQIKYKKHDRGIEIADASQYIETYDYIKTISSTLISSDINLKSYVM